MKVGKESEDSSRRNSNVLIVIVSFLLLVSIAMSVIGLLNRKKEMGVVSNSSEQTVLDIEKEINGGSLSDMFQKEFSETSANSEYEVNDPFKETCALVEGSGPVTTSFTVCQPH